jgi:hypothetical protein
VHDVVAVGHGATDMSQQHRLDGRQVPAGRGQEGVGRGVGVTRPLRVAVRVEHLAEPLLEGPLRRLDRQNQSVSVRHDAHLVSESG